MGKEKKGLGKGLKSIFGVDNITIPEGGNSSAPAAPKSGEVKVSTALIEPNGKQPRKNFDEENLKELTESVRKNGVLNPLLVQKNGATYKIIAGERRWRAAQAAGLKEVPVIIKDYTPQQAMEVSLIENIQRSDLNPVEEAFGYQMLIEEYGLKQEEVAEKVSKNRTTITNALRLLKLSEKVRGMLIGGLISAGHARALLGLEQTEAQDILADEIIAKNLSVRETEKLVQDSNKKSGKKKAGPDKKTDENAIFFRDYEDKMKEILQTKVRINRRDKNKGRIEIDYYSGAELERIMDLFGTIHS